MEETFRDEPNSTVYIASFYEERTEHLPEFSNNFIYRKSKFMLMVSVSMLIDVGIKIFQLT